MKYLGILLVALVLFSANAFSAGTLVGSKHDFSGNTWSGGQVCLPCHAPHGNYGPSDYLWNHKTTTATYTEWANTIKAGGVTEASRRCLSCHDGTVAVDAFNGGSGSEGMKMAEKTPSTLLAMGLGTDLTNDHPISIAYSSFITDATPSTRMNQAKVSSDGSSASIYGQGSNSTFSLRLIKNLAGGYNVECSTCHTAHGKAGSDGTRIASFLRMDNTKSAVCLTCHIK